MAWLGNVGDHVRTAQRLLGVHADARLGRRTRGALLRWQRSHELPKTGALDKPTWAGLQPATQERYVPRWTADEAARWGRRAGSPVLGRTSAGTAVCALQTALAILR